MQQMCKYTSTYYSIINRATLRDWKPTNKHYRFGTVSTPADIYTEVHHIVPICLGGKNNHSNLAVLTIKEHYICHLLLSKMHPLERKLAQAFYAMRRHVKDELFTVRLREFQSSHSKELWMSKDYVKKVEDGVSKYWDNPENRKLQSVRMKVVNLDPEILRKKTAHLKGPKSKGHKENIGKQSKIWMNSPEYKKKYSDRYQGSNFDNSRKVINVVTMEIYPSAQQAAIAINRKYEVVKKWLYKNIPKHDLMWLDNYPGGNN